MDLYKSDLEGMLNNPTYRTLVDDLKERRADHVKALSETLLEGPKEVAQGNKLVGMIEEIDFILEFPALILAEIVAREQEAKEGKDDGK